jgi:hypothetical protein
MKIIYYSFISLILAVSSVNAQIKKPTIQTGSKIISKPQVKIVEKTKVIKENNDRDGDGIIDSMDKSSSCIF